MADLAFRSATELLAAIRTKEISSRELLDLYLERIERLNPQINAVVALDVERARGEAAAADDAIARGERLGFLHGLPMTVKDSLETEGLVTTSGAPELRGHVPQRDAAAVARLRSAGAVVFGKSNLPTYAGDIQSVNPVYGTTNNPWDVTRTPGGSSGGAAAALAAGLTGFEVGSDIGGSIRNPAHYCGVYGLKPSYGIIPTRGHIPGPPGGLAPPDVAVLGPMGRGVSDLALGLNVLAGPDESEGVGWELRLPAARHSTLEENRVVAWFDDPALPVDGEVAECLNLAADLLGGAGVKVDRQARPAVDLARAVHLFEQLVFCITGQGSPEMFAAACAVEATPAEDGEDVMLRAGRAVAMRHRDWMGLNEERTRMRAAWADFFRDHDIVLMPVMPTAAFEHEHAGSMMNRTVSVNGTAVLHVDTLGWCGAVGAVYLPSAVIPVGRTKAGLPVGVQIVGPYLEDRTVVDVARRMSHVLGGFEPPAGF